MCAGVGSGGKFRKVAEGCGVCWRKFRRQVPEGSGVCCCGFRKVMEGSGEFRRGLVQEASCGGKFRRQVGPLVYRFRRHSSEGSGEFQCGLLPGNLDRSSHVIVLITFW